ncbi:hypothetical protein BDW71DRAFT_174946 [Aspergillus fruticulosus]
MTSHPGDSTRDSAMIPLNSSHSYDGPVIPHLYPSCMKHTTSIVSSGGFPVCQRSSGHMVFAPYAHSKAALAVCVKSSTL